MRENRHCRVWSDQRVYRPCERRRRVRVLRAIVLPSVYLVLALLHVQQSSSAFQLTNPVQRRFHSYISPADREHKDLPITSQCHVRFQSTLLETDTSSVNLPNTTAANTTSSPSWQDADQLVALKQSIDLVSFVETHYPLAGWQRTSSKRVTALCPFHDDHSPSLSIDGGRQIFKCFACGAGGDVFQFVRLYHQRQHAKGADDSMSYGQAIRHVTNIVNGVGDARWNGDDSRSYSKTSLSDVLRLKKERILLANAAAAGFYSQSLLEPWAGGVRSYLRSRRLSPRTVQSFALGYAADAYFGPGKGGDRHFWGEGSLVEHLEKLEFTPDELVGAGLAIVKKSSVDSVSVAATKDNEAVAPNATENTMTYSSLMDRFRGRLVIPIMDVTGKQVLGFGGRDLPLTGSTSSESHSSVPKYLNSPESLAFQKSKILFGLHKVNNLLGSDPSLVRQSSLLVVEGYMDAIVLWAAGVQGAVATMGTAISKEQLAVAARTAERLNGKVVLCLDNDGAGQAAVERICTNGMLKEVCSGHSVQVLVAQLPDGCKDPADFMDVLYSDDIDIGAMASEFQRRVVEKSKDWTLFYVDRILASYNALAPRGQSGSFGDIFERAADFIAESMSVGDRTKYAFEVALSMADIVARESNETESSSVVRSQLEFDLVDLVSRIADSREVMARRASAAADRSGDRSVQDIMATLTSGGTSEAEEHENKRSKDVTAKPRRLKAAKKVASSGKAPRVLVDASSDKAPRVLVDAKVAKPLVSHFAGFSFTPLDAAWLEERGNLLFVSSPKTRTYGPFKPTTDEMVGAQGRLRLAVPIFFNSNAYHGSRFLTAEAKMAGYPSDSPNNRDMDPSLIKDGIGFGPLVRPDVTRLHQDSETELLKALIRQPRARSAVRSVVTARKAIGISDSLIWSCADRKWLFHSLIDAGCEQSVAPDLMRSILAAQPDCPTTAFGSGLCYIAGENGGETFTNGFEGDLLDGSAPSLEKALELSHMRSAEAEAETEIEMEHGHYEPQRVESLVSERIQNSLSDQYEPDYPPAEYESLSLDSLLDLSTTSLGEEVTDQVWRGLGHETEESTQMQPARFHQSLDSVLTSGVLSSKAAYSATIGTLDRFFDDGFSDNENLMLEREHESQQTNFQRELAARCLYYTLQCAANSHRSEVIQKELKALAREREASSVASNTTDHVKLDEKSLQLTSEFRDTIERLVFFSDALGDIRTRLVYSTGDVAADGRISRNVQDKLAKALDEHLENLPNVSAEDDDNVDRAGEESLEAFEQSTKEGYGSVCDPNYFWTADDVNADRPLLDEDGDESDENEESLKDYESRVNDEWAIWLMDD
jgi:DNA primase catalytic core